MQPIAFSFKLLSFGSMLSLVSTTGAVEVHSLGDTTVSRFSLDKVVAKRTQLSRAAFLCLGKGTAHENCIVLPPEKLVN